MIHKIYANQKGFRQVVFGAGLNLVVADRSSNSDDRDTTNALGKSTLIDIIDFCLGSSEANGSGLRIEALESWVFSMDLEIDGHFLSVHRSIEQPNFVEIEFSTSVPAFDVETDRQGRVGLDVKKWREILGRYLFDLSDISSSGKYAPSARSILSYFIRNDPSAYNSPFEFFDRQKAWATQVYNSFLLGLDWKKAQKWQVLKDQKSSLTALKKALATGAISGETASLGELEAERIKLLSQSSKEDASLKSFEVLPQYKEIEFQANRLTGQIHNLVNANVIDRRRLGKFVDLSDSDPVVSDDLIFDLYRECGIVFPALVSKTLEQAQQFNRELLNNRKEFISHEVANLKRTIEEREAKVEALTSERAQFLEALDGRGALDEYTALQELHRKTLSALDDVMRRISQVKELSERGDELKIESVELKREAQIDYDEARESWARAVTLFSQFSEELYNEPGRLVIDITDTGYKFDVEIQGSPSEGISKMKVFCYDLMLAAYSRMREWGIDFLIHDSTIFDGVDPRQRAHALELADRISRQFGFQYICTINADMLPLNDFSEDFDIDQHVRLRLTDKEPSGSLMGFRF